VAIDIRRDMKARAQKLGRNPDHLKVMPGIAPVIGRTEAEAEEKHRYLQSLLTDEVALHYLSQRHQGFDFSRYDIDGPFPIDDIPPPSAAGTRTTYINLVEMVKREKPTIRALARKAAGSFSGMPYHGSARQLADLMEEWFQRGACDGFNLQPAYLPGVFNDFVELVVPLLKERGLMRTEYEGSTLRDYFGLPRPQSRYAAGSIEAHQSELA
jgi:alkanesulfonate monooxygenase SsuD/methylene tetrahydromethanopterin reductase-like flavin-dependent oxidoreductase (luciferase family)